MARIKLSLPSSFAFKTEISVRVTDLNYGNHLANDAIVSFLHIARIHFLDAMGLTELNIGGDASLIQGDLAVVYGSEGFLGDVIEVSLAVEEISNSSFDIYYLLHNRSQNKELARAKTRMVCFNYKERKVMRVPDSFKKRFESPE